jgi:hypothetical protein
VDSYPEVYRNFQQSFDIPLSVAGLTHQFVFSDGLTLSLTVHWVRDVTAFLSLHSHGFNTVVNVGDEMFQVRATDIPSSAAIYANDYITLDGVRKRIIQSRLREGIWTVQLRTIQTRDNLQAWT